MIPTVTAVLCLSLWPAAELQGHKVFRVREAATAHLARLGRFAYPALARGADSPTHETAVRCRRLLAVWEERDTWELSGRMLPQSRRLPWLFLDGYYGEDTRAWVAYAVARGAPSGGPGNSYEDHRIATRLWVQGQIRQFRSPREIRFDLAVMAAAEAEWTWREMRGLFRGSFLYPVRVPLP